MTVQPSIGISEEMHVLCLRALGCNPKAAEGEFFPGQVRNSHKVKRTYKVDDPTSTQESKIIKNQSSVSFQSILQGWLNANPNIEVRIVM
jgi:hypothetical protein